MRISDYLADQQILHELVLHAPAFSAHKRAKRLHVPGRRVAKCVLLVAPGGMLLAVLPATQHVDTKLLAMELGGPVRLANDQEMADTFRDCEWGVVPPFGRLYGLATLLDDAFFPDEMIVFEGNTHVEAIRVRCADFERLEKPRRLRLS